MDLAIATPLASALAEKGYDVLTAVQKAVLAEGVAGRDLLVSAQTGSGKTVAFGLAIAPEILNGADRLLYADQPMALVVAPTRELALQVKRELEWLYGPAGAQVVSCVGGMDYRTEKRALERGAHIVVGTPGRLRDHIERRSLDLSGLKAAILDEADEMLDLGFSEDLEFILGAAPQERRTLMFSATVPREIEKLAATFQRDALRIMAQGEARQHVDIEYRALSVTSRDKEHAIFNLLRFYEAQAAIVFCKTRVNVSHLYARMANRGFQVVALSGELSQAERTHALQALRDGRARVCIATDVAARGIDLPGLDLVIHFDLPSNSETLLHRSGRTGRAGRKGVSALIVPPAETKKAQRLLAGAKVSAEWGKAPGAEEVQEREDSRVMDHAFLAEAPGEEAEMAAALLSRYAPESVAAAFVRMWREGRSSPEVLSDVATPAAGAAAAAPRDRGDFGPSVWFRLSVGHSGRAEARWLLPKICEAGGITKTAIGAIRVKQDETFVQIIEAQAGRFGQVTELDVDLHMERLAVAPELERAERATAPRKAPARAEGAAPAARPVRAEKPAAAEKPARAEKPAYVPKASRFLDEEEAAPVGAAAPRASAAAPKPYTPRDEAPAKRDEAPRKPYAKRDSAERKPYAPREAGERKPYAPREAGERKPYAPREAGERKPYAARVEGAAKPYAKREDGERKPYAPRAAEGDAKKPRWSPEDKPVARSTGYKSHGGAADRPARAAGFKSHAAEGTGFKPRAEGEREPKRTYAAKGDDARPYAKREGPAGKPTGFKGRAAEGKKPFGARPKAAAPRGNAKDTSKRFVPPKGPRA